MGGRQHHSKTFTAEAEVDVDLSEWDTADLQDELENRQVRYFTDDLLEQMYQKFMIGKADDAVQMLKDLIRDRLGKFVK